ncbi:lipopolysaccharide heptosyltransferase II [Tengunoibacter tsumagoiensis]|uniref:lipopolysaccharide heptosyltransferase II n=1 Tax=Tengunoibacter tsumagoiensis TaxID=2014871 RepID=A0A402A336_9CHLR|nr:lipopolysaccharide heptosyltransferase II [Tengunoibacter tsumagoiensis]GCE13482.1 lipopolysaccharide heptosyltransferase II [Tengunoibacter tsumagoiensis]
MTQIAPFLEQRDDYGYPTRPTSRRTLRNVSVHISKRILLTIIFMMMSLLGACLRLKRIGKPHPALTPPSFHPRRILVLRMDLIGDLVLSLTVVRLLKRTYPEAEIDLLAVPASAKVIAGDPDLATIIGYDPNIWRRPQALFKRTNWQQLSTLRRQLLQRDYDLAVSVFGPWAALLSLVSGARRRLGFAQESYPGLMTDPVPGHHWQPGSQFHEVDYCLQLCQAAGAQPVPADRIPLLHVLSGTRLEIQELLLQAGVASDRPLIACHVSSNNGQSKRWPIPYWAKLIDKLIVEEKVNVILTGAPADQPLIEAIIKRTHQKVFNFAGKTSLVQLAALLQRADLMITGDSGPMHIAAAVNTPLIAIHGPTDPALSGPVNPTAVILRSDIWCSPCYTAKGGPADCRFFTTQCMKNITPAQVLSVAHEQLTSSDKQTQRLEKKEQNT